MKTIFALLSVLLCAFGSAQVYAKGFKWGRDYVNTTTRADGSKSHLVGPYDATQKKGVQDKKTLSGVEVKAHSHFVHDKNDKLMYSRIVPTQKTARYLKAGELGIVLKDDKGSSNLKSVVFGASGEPKLPAK